MALPGIIGLLVMIYMRPQEFEKSLKDFPFLYLFLGLSLLGMFIDIGTRRTRIIPSPQLPWALGLYFWAVTTIAIRKPSEFTSSVTTISVCLCLYLVIAFGVQRVPNFMKAVLAIFALGLFVASIGAHEGLTPFVCVMRNPGNGEANSYADGRDCSFKNEAGDPIDGHAVCQKDGKPGLAYGCEKIGFFGVSSVSGGRVRYLGVLRDPNELALATALTIPFAFAFFEQRRTTLRLVLLLFTLGTVALEIVFTQSRGGQVTFAAVLGAYFIKKYGWKRGILVGAVMAVPLVALGGRGGSEADDSALERLGCACAGIKMLMSYPITGVGFGQYTQYHFLTAHNAYILACGELGFPGAVMFIMFLYASLKIPASILATDLGESKEAETVKSMAMAMLSAFTGAAVGIFFLSWTYHYVLWITFGMSGALYSTAKGRFRQLDVRISAKEVGRVALGLLIFLVVYSLYIKKKGAWE